MFNRSAIAKEAHRIARLYRGGKWNYRKALAYGFRQAWQSAKGVARIIAADAAITAEQRARRDEAIVIQCRSDRLTKADHDRLHELAHAA